MGQNNRRTPKELIWNDGDILDSFNRSAVLIHQAFARHGLKSPTRTALYIIVSRERIPDRWRPAFLYLAIKDRGFSSSSMIAKSPPEIKTETHGQ